MTISPLDRVRLARSFVAIVRDPKNLDDVLEIGDRIAERELDDAQIPPLIQQAARQLGAPAPLPPLTALRELPEGTVGREYANFMDANGLVPEALDRPTDDTELARFRAHMRTSHDLWHVATGWTPDLLGELGLQAFYLAQLRVPFPAFILAAGLLHTVLKRREHFYDIVDAVAEGWRQGAAADSLLTLDWTAWMHRPVQDLRAHLALTAAERRPAPVVPLVA